MSEDQVVETNQEQTEAEKKDIEENKVMALLAYIISFIPLIAAKDSKFAMFHANQGLLLFLTAIAINVIGWIIPFLGWLLIIPLGSLLVIGLAIYGIINAVQGEKKELPIIGKFELIKQE